MWNWLSTGPFCSGPLLHGDVWYCGQNRFVREPQLDSFDPQTCSFFHVKTVPGYPINAINSSFSATSILNAKLKPGLVVLSSSNKLQVTCRCIKTSSVRASSNWWVVVILSASEPSRRSQLSLISCFSPCSLQHSDCRWHIPTPNIDPMDFNTHIIAWTMFVNWTIWRWVSEEPGLICCRVWRVDGWQVSVVGQVCQLIRYQGIHTDVHKKRKGRGELMRHTGQGKITGSKWKNWKSVNGWNGGKKVHTSSLNYVWK